ncbi:ankyrin repeat domain-containing protein [Candidatus Cardinium hertigii]|uniref:ankyrin repeat domain-containing protein n=1 Tax=Candidatus Cardinium hertigii TaxID=247481 RepID=UPI003D7C5E09
MHKRHTQRIVSSKLMTGLNLGLSLVLTTSCSKLSGRYGMHEINQKKSNIINANTARQGNYSRLNTELNEESIDDKGNTLLHIEVMKGNIKMVNQLIDDGYNIDLKNKDLYTPLHLAVESHNGNAIKLLKALIEKNACVNVQNKYGYSPLHIACKKGDIEKVKILLSSTSINVNIKDDHGHTPLHSVVGESRYHRAGDPIFGKYKYKKVVKILLSDQRIDVNLKNNDGNTPFHITDRSDILKLLVKHPDFNTIEKDKDGNTPLHIAVSKGFYRYDLLLQHPGINVNEKNNDGNTPLHIAATKGALHTYDLLLQHSDFNVNAKNKDGIILHCILQ